MALTREVWKAKNKSQMKSLQFILIQENYQLKTFRYRPKYLLSNGKTCLWVSSFYVRFELIEAPEIERASRIKNANLINQIKARIMFSLNPRCGFRFSSSACYFTQL